MSLTRHARFQEGRLSAPGLFRVQIWPSDEGFSSILMDSIRCLDRGQYSIPRTSTPRVGPAQWVGRGNTVQRWLLGITTDGKPLTRRIYGKLMLLGVAHII